jgi:hypothetical protein
MKCESLICPFCGENDFDEYGLKRHLIKWCIDFDKIDIIEILRIMDIREKVNSIICEISWK